MRKTIIRFLMVLLIFMSSIVFLNTASAHSALLDVEYDGCFPMPEYDHKNEIWYILESQNDGEYYNYHISHETTTIKYYFESEALNDSNYTWTSDISETVAEEIKTAYANSMKKWNNVYFYDYNSSGQIIKKKVINIEEGTLNDHNLSIYPIENGSIYNGKAFDSISSTNYIQTSSLEYESIDTGIDNLYHRHGVNWYMNVNVHYFYENDAISLSEATKVRNRNGAHELGHVLGLRDVDVYCSSTWNGKHHEELLMGYGEFEERSENITYKDIAGVAITRGFHTDEDHKWLYDDDNSTEGNYKLICSICNGVKYTESLADYQYDALNSCGGLHNITEGNMMAVASYGTKDYYKCKYCRYVAPFNSIIEQNYTYTSSGYVNHLVTNAVNGLGYTFTETHESELSCNKCGFSHEHTYDNLFKSYSSTLHKAICSCGKFVLQGHAIIYGNNRCLLCGAIVSSNSGIIMSNSIVKISANGSKVLTNSIILLVEEDVEAYLSGTLIFYDYGSVTVSS